MFTDEKYLGAYSLESDGKYTPVVVTIEKVFTGEFTSQGGKEQRPFIKFKEFDKHMVVNRTNFKRLEKFFNSFNPNDYVGKQIVLGVENVSSPEGMVPALRFSTRPIPKQELPAITDEEFEKTKVSIQSGKTTVEKVEKIRTLTAEQKEELLNIKP